MRFSRKEKKVANGTYKSLVDEYAKTEIDLKRACRIGDKKAMDAAMANHKTIEYALLYRETPEFRKKRSKK